MRSKNCFFRREKRRHVDPAIVRICAVECVAIGKRYERDTRIEPFARALREIRKLLLQELKVADPCTRDGKDLEKFVLELSRPFKSIHMGRELIGIATPMTKYGYRHELDAISAADLPTQEDLSYV